MDTTILLVDDQENVRKSIGDYLTNHGFHVVLAEGGAEAIAYLQVNTPDLIILDVEMPSIDGLDVCREVRRSPNWIPIIMISGERKEVIDRIIGLEVGADKYLLKPFELPLLRAEMWPLLQKARASAQEGKPSSYTYKDSYLQIDQRNRQAVADSIPVSLTVLEFDLLEYLVHKNGTPCSRDDLIEYVWNDMSGAVSDSAVTSCIKRLRKKIEPNPKQPTYIHSVHGWGYKFSGRSE
ncbi:MAG: response regulator transcription factor [Chloroflexota bacterium]